MIYLSLSLLVLSGVAKGFMDLSADDKLSPHLNKINTWRNKWKNGDHLQGEKFLGSSTVFVALTDPWHAAQLVFLNCLIIGTVLFSQSANIFWSIVVASVLPRVAFEINYRYLGDRK